MLKLRVLLKKEREDGSEAVKREIYANWWYVPS